MLKYLLLIAVALSLSGCMLAVVGGAAAAGGYYLGNNYEITQKSSN